VKVEEEWWEMSFGEDDPNYVPGLGVRMNMERAREYAKRYGRVLVEGMGG
jgi:hypothetical protein